MSNLIEDPGGIGFGNGDYEDNHSNNAMVGAYYMENRG